MPLHPLRSGTPSPMTECREIPGNPVKKQGFPSHSASVRRDGRAEIAPELLKSGRGNCPYAHFSASAGVFVRQKQDFFAERNFFLAAKTKISCRKEIPGSVESGEKRGFGRLFLSIWRISAYKIRLPFCKPFPRLADAGAASVRTASRGGRQSVAGNGLPAFILHSRKSARFAYFRPSPPLLPPVRFSRSRF